MHPPTQRRSLTSQGSLSHRLIVTFFHPLRICVRIFVSTAWSSLSQSLQAVHRRCLDPPVGTIPTTLTHGRDTYHHTSEGVSPLYVRSFAMTTTTSSHKAVNTQDWTSHTRNSNMAFKVTFSPGTSTNWDFAISTP